MSDTTEGVSVDSCEGILEEFFNEISGRITVSIFGWFFQLIFYLTTVDSLEGNPGWKSERIPDEILETVAEEIPKF